MKKVLIIIGEINKAGIANAALNFYRACTKYYKDEIRFDFVTTVEPNNELRKEFEENKTQYFLIKRIKCQGIIHYIHCLRNIIRNNGLYSAIHCHLGGVNWLACKAAEREQIKNIVAHAHGSAGPNKIYDFIISKFFSKLNIKYSTIRYTCSDSAGKYVFGTRYEFLPNIIEKSCLFNIKSDNIYHKGTYKKIVGYLGLFEGQKNAGYLVKIMKHADMQDILCVAAGDGPYLKETQDMACRYGVHNIIFLGYRNDPIELLKTYDVLLMPSLSEGMSMSLLQAQLIGTPCVVSKGVPDTNDLQLGLFTKVDDFNVENWVAAINKSLNQEQNKDDYSINERYNHLKEIGYDAETIADRLYKSYTLNN